MLASAAANAAERATLEKPQAWRGCMSEAHNTRYRPEVNSDSEPLPEPPQVATRTRHVGSRRCPFAPGEESDFVGPPRAPRAPLGGLGTGCWDRLPAVLLGLLVASLLPRWAQAHEALLGPSSAGPGQPSSLERAAVSDAESLVGNSGQLSYQVRFELPPGRGGSTPELGLVYSSAHGTDLAGLGWSLTGLPVIRRVSDHKGILFESDDEVAFVEGGLNAPHSRNMILGNRSRGV